MYNGLFFRMEPLHRDMIPCSRFYRIRPNSIILKFIAQGRWYNIDYETQRDMVMDMQRNKFVEICHSPAGVWLRFEAFDQFRTTVLVFIRLTDIVLVTKRFELQLVSRRNV